MKLKIFLIAFIFSLSGNSLSATTQTAHDFVNELTTDILQVAQESTSENYKEKIGEVIDGKYKERIDFLRMARITTGKAFNAATEKQRSALVDEYSRFIIGMISSSVYEFSDNTVNLLPLEKDVEAEKIKIGLVMKDPVSKDENRVDFALHSRDGSWKIYDLYVLDESTLKSHKSQFKDIISNDGFDGVIELLKDRNQKKAG